MKKKIQKIEFKLYDIWNQKLPSKEITVTNTGLTTFREIDPPPNPHIKFNNRDINLKFGHQKCSETSNSENIEEIAKNILIDISEKNTEKIINKK